YICSYECTLCPPCATSVHGVCPNCGGELSNRPRRKTVIENAQNSGVQSARDARPWLIWVISLGLWTLVGVAAGLSMYQLDRSMGKSVPLGEGLVRPLVNYLTFCFLTPFLWGFAIHHPIQRDNWARRSLQYALAAVAFCVAH